MAKYQKYAEYKDSGVQWIGEIPDDWKFLRGKWKFNTLKEVNRDLQCMDRLALTMNGVIERSIDSDEGLQPAEFSGYQIFEKNDLVFKLIDLENFKTSRVGLVFKRGIMSPAYIRLRPLQGTYSRFFYYFYFDLYLRGVYNQIGGQGVRSALNATDLLEIEICVPALEEQIQIANFLDHETAKIDTLIAKQEKLIELLKEKRQALISHAVTKGLNPNVQMKDSGVEWLGEVPEHWRVIKFNHVVQIRNGLVDPRDEKFKNLVLYAPNHIEKATGKILYKETAEEQGADSNKYLCFKGEVIYSKIRPALAKVAICEEATALCSADMYPMDSYNGLTNQFLYYFILSDSFTEAVILDSDRVAMPKINRESLSDYKLPIPPINEQLKIIDFIEMTGTKLDCLETKAAQAIQLMQERRTALISAAVTGKIDVRNWQNPNKNKEANMELSA